MRKIIVYISGAYTNGGTFKNILKARDMAIKIWEAGFTPFCPHTNNAYFENVCKCTYRDYLEGDIEILKVCSCILMLDNWKESNGAISEHIEANLNDKPIFYSLNELIEFYKEKTKC